MGTITIEQYSRAGSGANTDQPIANLTTLKATTKDATTSTTAESIALDSKTKVIRVLGVEAHRVVLGTDTTADTYATVPAGQFQDYGVNGGEVLYYELDA